MAPGSTSRNRLSRELILGTALALASEIGVASLSFRRIAERLGVTPMALYKHVDSKKDLLAGVLDLIVEQAEVTAHDTPREDWRRWTVETFVRTYQSLIGRTDVVQLIASLDDLTPATRSMTTTVLDVLRDAGFQDGDAIRLFSTLIRFVMGGAILPPLRISPSDAVVPSVDEGIRLGIETIIDGFAVSTLIDARLQGRRTAS